MAGGCLVGGLIVVVCCVFVLGCRNGVFVLFGGCLPWLQCICQRLCVVVSL